jgi:3-hydroxybutyryl-CoA dehydrogenase
MWPKPSPLNSPQELTTVAIIGAGPLGRWLALAAARAGYTVLLEDVMPANLHHAQEYIRRQYSPGSSHLNSAETAGPELVRPNLPAQGFALSKSGPESEEASPPESSSAQQSRLEGTGVSPYVASSESEGASAPEARPSASPPVHFVSTIEEAVRDADLAIDCVPDELESKLEILWLLDRMAPPRTVLVTPTTRLSIADLASCTYRPGKCVAIVVEAGDLTAPDRAISAPATAEGIEDRTSELLLRTTLDTTAETIAIVETFWHRLGFTPRFEPDPTE